MKVRFTRRQFEQAPVNAFRAHSERGVRVADQFEVVSLSAAESSQRNLHSSDPAGRRDLCRMSEAVFHAEIKFSARFDDVHLQALVVWRNLELKIIRLHGM